MHLFTFFPLHNAPVATIWMTLAFSYSNVELYWMQDTPRWFTVLPQLFDQLKLQSNTKFHQLIWAQYDLQIEIELDEWIQQTKYSCVALEANKSQLIPFAFETFGASGQSLSFADFLKTVENRYQRLISWNLSTDIADKSSLF